MTQDEIIDLAIQAGLSKGHAHGMPLFLEDFAKLVAAKAIKELESQEPFCYAYKENGEDFFAPKDGYYPADAKPLYTHPPQRREPPDWFPAVENILEVYGLQAIDFVADFKEAMKDAEQSQRIWVGLTNDELTDLFYNTNLGQASAVAQAIELLKEKNT
jgi:hypothetical protein